MDNNGNTDRDRRECPYDEYNKFEKMTRFLPPQNEDAERMEGDRLRNRRRQHSQQLMEQLAHQRAKRRNFRAEL